MNSRPIRLQLSFLQVISKDKKNWILTNIFFFLIAQIVFSFNFFVCYSSIFAMHTQPDILTFTLFLFKNIGLRGS